jgi:cytochrome c biogenesis protein CcmG/thiol:disulfide interchange protein DsbE
VGQGLRHRVAAVLGVTPAVLLVAAAVMLAGCSGAVGMTASQKTAPDFSGHTLDGAQVSMADYQGKPLVLNFMATWCGPCMAEAPEIDQFYIGSRDRVGFLAIAVNDTQDALKSVLTDKGWTFPVMFDGDSAASAYGVTAIPTTVVIDAQGHIVKRIIGGTTAAELALLIDGLTPTR